MSLAQALNSRVVTSVTLLPGRTRRAMGAAPRASRRMRLRLRPFELARAGRRPRASMGMVMRKCAPGKLAVDDLRSVPPCAETNSSTTDRPMPVPLTAVLLAARPV